MFFVANAVLKGIQAARRKTKNGEGQEGFQSDRDGGYVDPDVFEAFLWFLGWLLFLIIAVTIATTCGAPLRDYVVVVLDPWVYLMIRAVVPCSRAAPAAAFGLGR